MSSAEGFVCPVCARIDAATPAHDDGEPSDAMRLANQFQTELNAPLTLNGREALITAPYWHRAEQLAAGESRRLAPRR